MKQQNHQPIVIYQAKSGPELKVRLNKETIWLTQADIALLFGTQRPAITKHLHNIFSSGELEKKSVYSILEHTADDGKVYKTQYYNLDVIISVGYRVNSMRATQFRIWATKILKQHLFQGYTINEKRLKENQTVKLREMERAVSLLQRIIETKQLNCAESEGLLRVITDYTKSWLLFQQYDQGKLRLVSNQMKKITSLNYNEAVLAIEQLKIDLRKRKEAGDLFGQERDGGFKGILEGLNQAFGGQEVYPALEQKAAHLLYFIIKDHPFIDGNKRIGSFLFIIFLVKNSCLLNKKGEKKINDNALVALALLIAESDPKEKDTMIILITNLLFEKK